jgi:hypothetical protein
MEQIDYIKSSNSIELSEDELFEWDSIWKLFEEDSISIRK